MAASVALDSACDDLTCAKKAELLTALAAVDVKTTDDLLDYRLEQLCKEPPDLPTAETLLDLCKTKTVAVDKADAVWLTALGKIIKAAKATKSGTHNNKDLKKADLFGESRYDKIPSLLGSRVLPHERYKGRHVARASEELDRGTLTSDTFELAKLAGSFEEESAIEGYVNKSGLVELNLGNRGTLGATASRNGEVLHQIWCFCMMMLAAGGRPVTAIKDKAASTGAYGLVKSIASGVATRWHVTFDALCKYFVSALTASSTMNGYQLREAHAKLHELIVEDLHSGYNYESAIFRVLDKNKFNSFDIPPQPTTAKGAGTSGARQTNAGPSGQSPREKSKRETDLERENANLRATAKQAKQAGGGGASPTKAGKAKAGAGADADLCWKFQANKCNDGASCRFVHKCAICGSTAHSGADHE